MLLPGCRAALGLEFLDEFDDLEVVEGLLFLAAVLGQFSWLDDEVFAGDLYVGLGVGLGSRLLSDGRSVSNSVNWLLTISSAW